MAFELHNKCTNLSATLDSPNFKVSIRIFISIFILISCLKCVATRLINMRHNQLYKCCNHADYLFSKIFSHNFYATTFFKCYKKVAQCDKKTFSVCFGYYVSMSRQYDYFPKGQVNFYSLKVMYSRSLNLHFIIKT